MGKSKQGGVFGYLRGKVGTVSYSVLSAKNSSSGKKEQVVRALPESVSNPQTAAQSMQRMKLAPAQKFYAAFSALLSNAFQGVAYGEASRRYFLSKCMTAEGPYIQRGVDRFIPAAYPFSEGSIPSIGIEPFDGGVTAITLANEVTLGSEVTPEVLADALGVTTDYQITVAVVNNVNGVFVPSYVGYDDRLRIADMPANSLSSDQFGHITINPGALGLDVSAMVACCVVLSVQDASGAWLRSEQSMVISNELRDQLYSADALEAAIYSYQDGNTVNAINSEWYYNLGMSQAWGGRLITVRMPVTQDDEPGYAEVIMGVRQINGRIIRTVFATSTEPTGKIMCVLNGATHTYGEATVDEFTALNGTAYEIEIWHDSYASQLDIAVTPPTYRKAYWRTVPETQYAILVNELGQVLTGEDGGWGEQQSLLNITKLADGTCSIIEDVTSAQWYDQREVVQTWGVEAGVLSGNTSPMTIDLPEMGNAEAFTYEGARGESIREVIITPAVTNYPN